MQREPHDARAVHREYDAVCKASRRIRKEQEGLCTGDMYLNP